MRTESPRLRREYTKLTRHLSVLFRTGRCLPAACGICAYARTQRPGASAPRVRCSYVVCSLGLHSLRCRGKSKLIRPSAFLAPNTGTSAELLRVQPRNSGRRLCSFRPDVEGVRTIGLALPDLGHLHRLHGDGHDRFLRALVTTCGLLHSH